MLDWPARMKTLRGLAEEDKEEMHSSDAVRMTFDFIVVYCMLRGIILLVMRTVISKAGQKAETLIRRFSC
jgi:hypothetical protein